MEPDRFAAYVGELASVIGHADRVMPLHDYCTGCWRPRDAEASSRSQRRRHERSVGAASAAVASRQPGRLVGGVGIGQGARAGDPDHRARRTDQGVDHRRYLLPQAGQPFGRRPSSVLRAARQAGQLPGGGDVVDRQSSRQSADRLSAVSSAITRNSSRRSGSTTTRAAVGGASTITPPCASRPYGCLISERERIPPSGPRSAAVLAKPAIPSRPRGAADQAATPHPQLDRHHASKADCSHRPHPAAMGLAVPADFRRTGDEIYDSVRLIVTSPQLTILNLCTRRPRFSLMYTLSLESVAMPCAWSN